MKASMSLQRKLLLSFFAILLVLLSLLGISQHLNMKKYLINSKIRELQARCHSMDLKLLSSITDTNQSNKDLFTLASSLTDRIINVLVIDSTGALSYKIDNTEKSFNSEKSEFTNHKVSKDFARFKPIPISEVPIFSASEYTTLLNESGNLENKYQIIEQNGCSQIMIWRKIGDPNSPSGLIQLSASISDIEEILHKQLFIFIGISISVLILGWFIGRFIFRKVLLPVNKMTADVEKIETADEKIRLTESTGIVEIDTLSHSFNNMLDRIKLSFDKEQQTNEKMKQFISNASHELRTPLTSISGFVEVLLMGAAKNEDQLNSSLESILSESNRLTKLVNDLLSLSRLDQQLIIRNEEESLNHILCELHPQLQILAGKRQVIYNINTDATIIANKDHIKQVILNIFQNAVRHTDHLQGKIELDVYLKYIDDINYVVLSITDNGSGIKKEHLQKIFHRFFRGESHRSRNSGGYGLGLSIVKSIIDSIGGKIEVESVVNVGTTFRVYFIAL